jgi:outer membrane protein OmpA-like peptidoglycan-associated protein
VAAFAQAEALVGSDGALLEPGGPLSFLNAARQRLAQWQSRTDLVSSAEIVRALRGGVALRPAIHLRVSFDFDQASLNARGLDQVERLRAALRDPALSDECFRIIGHTDVRGSDAYNDALSLRRAETVRRVVDTSPALVGRLRVEGHGKRELLRKGTTEEDHRINRRVEVRVIACGRS